jgi:hypothetical protein
MLLCSYFLGPRFLGESHNMTRAAATDFVSPAFGHLSKGQGRSWDSANGPRKDDWRVATESSLLWKVDLLLLLSMRVCPIWLKRGSIGEGRGRVGWSLDAQKFCLFYRGPRVAKWETHVTTHPMTRNCSRFLLLELTYRGQKLKPCSLVLSNIFFNLSC